MTRLALCIGWTTTTSTGVVTGKTLRTRGVGMLGTCGPAEWDGSLFEGKISWTTKSPKTNVVHDEPIVGCPRPGDSLICLIDDVRVWYRASNSSLADISHAGKVGSQAYWYHRLEVWNCGWSADDCVFCWCQAYCIVFVEYQQWYCQVIQQTLVNHNQLDLHARRRFGRQYESISIVLIARLHADCVHVEVHHTDWGNSSTP